MKRIHSRALATCFGLVGITALTAPVAALASSADSTASASINSLNFIGMTFVEFDLSWMPASGDGTNANSITLDKVASLDAPLTISTTGTVMSDTGTSGATSVSDLSFLLQGQRVATFSDGAFHVPTPNADGSMSFKFDSLAFTETEPLPANQSALSYDLIVGGTGFSIDGLPPSAVASQQPVMSIDTSVGGGAYGVISSTLSATVVPEPATFSLYALGLGLLGASVRARRAATPRC